MNTKFSDFDGAIRKGDIAKGMMAGADMPGVPTRSKRLTPESETNKTATEAHTGNPDASTPNTGTSSTLKVAPYQDA